MGTVWSYFLHCCHLSSISWRGLWQAHDFFWHSLSRERVPSRRVFVKFLVRSLSSCLSSRRFAQIKGTDDTLLHCAIDYDFKCYANGVSKMVSIVYIAQAQGSSAHSSQQPRGDQTLRTITETVHRENSPFSIPHDEHILSGVSL